MPGTGAEAAAPATPAAKTTPMGAKMASVLAEPPAGKVNTSSGLGIPIEQQVAQRLAGLTLRNPVYMSGKNVEAAIQDLGKVKKALEPLGIKVSTYGKNGPKAKNAQVVGGAQGAAG